MSKSVEAAYEELNELVGKKGDPYRGEVKAGDIRRFARASGETSDVYFDAWAASRAGHPGIPAPPLMLPSVIEWDVGPALEELRDDGTGVSKESWLPIAGLRVMGGGQDLEFHRNVYAGDHFEALPVLESVERKEGSSGVLILLTILTKFSTEDAGEDLVTCRETLIVR